MSDQVSKKRIVAEKALEWVPDQGVLGVGTGSTVDFFIQKLKFNPDQPDKVVSSSQRTTKLLIKEGFDPISPNEVSSIDCYVDGADHVNASFACIKGAGGAMTLEKLLCLMSKTFVCIVDDSKICDVFPEGAPVPIEVAIPYRSYVARHLTKLGAFPVLREGRTDLGNAILDVYQLDLINFQETGALISKLHGVVGHGLFTEHPIDVLIQNKDQAVSVSFNDL